MSKPLSTDTAIAFKVSFDILQIALSLVTLVLNILTYDSDFHISPLSITYSFTVNSLSSYVKSSYDDFDNYLCKTSITKTHEVCDKIDNFRIAGEIYLILSILANLFTLYSILNLIGKKWRCSSRGCFHLDFSQYINPVLFILCFLLYCIVANVFNSRASLEIGFVTMVFCNLISIIGIIFYFAKKKTINEHGFLYNIENKQEPSEGSELESSKIDIETIKKTENDEEKLDPLINTGKVPSK
ncbi:hypothetical protein SteCoe_29066 [Stentor coeruleus]|uniref:Uncharacterized protein n=1 Tax=Stentor coeruleus TaxID=5963 RepID=A0A1R2B6P3_9CILI|nr:hypothetical protein SteCoe_29066 [Stentor coeruleus]